MNTRQTCCSRQVDNINKHVLRLRQLAVAAKAAGDAEDYAMDAGNEGEAPARDPASLQRVEQVHMTSGEIERMTPQLITAAQVIKPFDFFHLRRFNAVHAVIACLCLHLSLSLEIFFRTRKENLCHMWAEFVISFWSCLVGIS